MIRRSTWILLALFVLVLAGAWGFQRYKAQQSAKVTPTASAENLFQIQENTLVSLRVENNQGKAVALGRNAQGMWTITEPQEGKETDTASAESAVTQLVSLQSQFSLGMPDNLAEYGLLKPAYTITLVSNGGEKHVVLVGAEAPAVSGYYIQLDGSAPKVVSKYSLDPVLQMIETPPYKATETPTLAPASGTPGVETPGAGTPASSTTPAAASPTSILAPTPTPTAAPATETQTPAP